MKRKFLLFLTSFAVIINTGISKAQWISHHKPVFQGIVPQPAAGVPITDLKFRTSVIRITDARSLNLKGIVPVYSKRQAWNSDESYLLLADNGNGNVRLYNGISYQFIGNLPDVSGEDIFWSPADPDLIYFNPDSVLNTYRISTGQINKLYAFTLYSFANTRGEGNLSNDGKYYAIAGQHYNYTTGDVTISDILVFDIQSNAVIKTIPLPGNLTDFDWVSISPLGNYVVVDYADWENGRYHGLEVYDRNLNFIWQKPLGPGHSDMGIDAGNQEMIIMEKYDSDADSTFIMKYRLSDGQETKLLGLSARFDLHISCRNEQRRDWCFISTFDYMGRLTDDSLSWMPFEDELFALKMDGSRKVERIAHHHSRRFSPSTPDADKSVYAAEPHATINRSGDRILFGSNWRTKIDQESSVDTYVADFKSFLGFNEIYNIPGIKGIVFPNPVRETACFRFLLNEKSEVNLEIKDITGKILKTVFKLHLEKGFHEIPFTVSSIPSGIYLACLQTDHLNLIIKIAVTN